MKADHLSSLLVARQIKRLLHDSHSRAKLRIILLAADRVYLLIMSPLQVVSSYLTLFTFTPLQKRGSIVSVALSLGLPLVAVNNCHCPYMLPGLSSLHRLMDGDQQMI